jgi:hypothetical protein
MPADWRVLSAQQAEALLCQLPTLAEHACKSGGATRFGERIVGALLPHAVEHVAIDLLVRRFPGAGAISGNSVRLNNTEMQVRISRCSSVAPQAVARALRDAVQMVNDLRAPCHSSSNIP